MRASVLTLEDPREGTTADLVGMRFESPGIAASDERRSPRV
jgi:hypothetical protein